MTKSDLEFNSQYSFLNAVRGDILRFISLKYPHYQDRLSSLRFFISCFSPFLYPNYIYRLSALLYFRNFPFFSILLSRLNILLFDLEISPRCKIGPGIFFPHPRGIILGAYSVGSNVTIYHRVTVGAKRLSFSYSSEDRPIICDSVILGFGSTILGSICVGQSSIVSRIVL